MVDQLAGLDAITTTAAAAATVERQLAGEVERPLALIEHEQLLIEHVLGETCRLVETLLERHVAIDCRMQAILVRLVVVVVAVAVSCCVCLLDRVDALTLELGVHEPAVRSAADEMLDASERTSAHIGDLLEDARAPLVHLGDERVGALVHLVVYELKVADTALARMRLELLEPSDGGGQTVARFGHSLVQLSAACVHRLESQQAEQRVVDGQRGHTHRLPAEAA